MHLFQHQFKNVLVLQHCMETKCFLALDMIGFDANSAFFTFLPTISLLIQKRFGTETLHGNKMFPSLKYDWMQIVHTPPCYLPISRFEMYIV